MKETEKLLLDALRQSLHPQENQGCLLLPENEYTEREFLEMARKHAVLPFLYDACEKQGLAKDTRYANFWQQIRQVAATTARANYRLLFVVKYITELLEKESILIILLKGASTASYYPTPELRKSGDVDILIPQERDFRRAVELLEKEGFARCESQSALHHMELKNEEGISVELHCMLAEPFESGKMNHYLETLLAEYREHVEKNDSWGVAFNQPTDAYHAFYLVVHMLQHFLRAGFGLKFLCDWTVFWNREIAAKEKETFLRLLQESGTQGFVAALTEACVKYLGLREENVLFLLGDSHGVVENCPAEEDWQQLAEEFMEEVFISGEFGRGDKQRMVAMRGTGFAAYAREFHHQMHLNYPGVGKVFFLWPFLWALTLARFMQNNRSIRKVKSMDILKEARRRSKLIDRMKLF